MVKGKKAALWAGCQLSQWGSNHLLHLNLIKRPDFVRKLFFPYSAVWYCLNLPQSFIGTFPPATKLIMKNAHNADDTITECMVAVESVLCYKLVAPLPSLAIQ